MRDQDTRGLESPRNAFLADRRRPPLAAEAPFLIRIDCESELHEFRNVVDSRESKRERHRTIRLRYGAINPDPEVHRVQFLASARFQIEEQLRPIRRTLAENVKDHELPTRDGQAIEPVGL